MEESKAIESSLQQTNQEPEAEAWADIGTEDKPPESEEKAKDETDVSADPEDAAITADTSPSSASKAGSYRIPKLSGRRESSETNEAQDKPEEDQATCSVVVKLEDPGSSDSELLVDESMEVQSEVTNNETEQTENGKSPVSKNEKEKNASDDDNRSRKRRRSRTRSRSPNRDRSRSRDRDRRRHDSETVPRMNSDSPDMVRSRVFVGHLNTDRIGRNEVERLFSPYGKVVGIALNKGYGFVQYDNEHSARAAIREVHGTPLGGMKIVVDKTVALKKLLGEDPKSEPPLPREPLSRRRERDYEDDMEDLRRRDIHSRYSRLEELERYIYDRYSQSAPPRRDPYYDSYYDRPPPPSYTDSYNRHRYSDMERERDRYPMRERERYPPPPSGASYYDRRRDDYYDERRPMGDGGYYSGHRY